MTVDLDQAKAVFAQACLARVSRPLGFVDVGSGGPLKAPWSLLPTDKVRKHDIDPETEGGGERPLCISDHASIGPFHVARDPRSSSVHSASPEFMARYGIDAHLVERVVEVQYRTLDELFLDVASSLDIMDVNAEGHDLQVLRGGEAIFAKGFFKLLKVEYELVEVWQGQGWFADIDNLLRGRGFNLVSLVNDTVVPVLAAELGIGGEPIWGKALYVPGPEAWRRRAAAVDPQTLADDVWMAISLYTLFDLPGRALELVALLGGHGGIALPSVDDLRRQLVEVYRHAPPPSLPLRLWRLLPADLRVRFKPAVARVLGLSKNQG